MISRLSTNTRSGAGAVGRLGDGSLISSGAWWLAGGIDPANCIAAYQPKGAESYAASKLDHTGNGNYATEDGAGPINWSALNGWADKPDAWLGIVIGLSGYSIVVRSYTTISSYYSVVADANYPDSPMWGISQAWRDYAGNVFFGAYKNAGVSGVGDHVLALAGTNGYVDGVLRVSNAANSRGNKIRAFTDRNSGVSIYSYAVYNVTITPAQVSALTDAMNAL